MTHRTALMTAAALTAFLLVVVGGVIGRLSQPNGAEAASAGLAQPQIQFEPAQVPTQDAPSSASSPTYAVSPASAAALALQGAPGARLSRAPELVNFQGVVAYEVPLDRGLVYLDASSGRVLYDGTTAAATGRGARSDDEHGSRGRGERHDDDDDDDHDDDD